MSIIPFCEAADPFVNKPTIAIPEGAVDCHAHVFSSRYPYCETRTYTPPDASVGAYLHLHQQLGIRHGVLVQPSVYGNDNQLHLDTLRYLRQQGYDYKGVAVVDADVSEQTLDELQEAGFCGVRMNLLFKGGIEWRDVERLAARLAERYWHLQCLIDVSQFDDLYQRLMALPVPVVIDHLGHMPTTKLISHPSFQALLKLKAEGKVWTKLSAPYRLSPQSPPYDDVSPFAQALLEANEEQCVWGSDWPHPCFAAEMPNDGQLLDTLWHWTQDTTLFSKILVDNPKRLYRF
ncbi:GntR family transcriptional regulator [Vibrio alginolyticus]|uniref:amidohydrolase family protein n=1 Tax=Vibrio alginolyticus TaxID=663 RepID=UPI00102D74B5|nr:amidohydrolase family protein [Vibrio alginolyticus]RZV18761.1 GntR family transcriptional regulator [Vibrio alginolyticus]